MVIKWNAATPETLTMYEGFHFGFLRLGVNAAFLTAMSLAARATTSLSVMSRTIRGLFGCDGGPQRKLPSPSSSPASHASSTLVIVQGEQRGSNPHPPDPQSDAPPVELYSPQSCEGRDRTCDRLLNREPLLPLSYFAMLNVGEPGIEPGQPDLQAGALPSKLFPRHPRIVSTARGALSIA